MDNDTIMHLQQFEIGPKQVASQDLFHIGHEFEIRKQIAMKLSNKQPYVSMNLEAGSPLDAVLDEPDVELEINALANAKRQLRRTPPVPITNIQFYDKTLQALIDGEKNNICNSDHAFSSIKF